MLSQATGRSEMTFDVALQGVDWSPCPGRLVKSNQRSELSPQLVFPLPTQSATA